MMDSKEEKEEKKPKVPFDVVSRCLRKPKI